MLYVFFSSLLVLVSCVPPLSADNMDFSYWSYVLNRLVYNGTKVGMKISMFNYSGLTNDTNYKIFSTQVESADLTGINYTQYMAFWINIYNYLVVRVIRENPCATDAFGVCRPISSIIEIGVQQPSSFVSPVWKKPVLHIRSLQEEGMSIEDVEEKLKNPPFPGPKDPRIIACLACSTISCADIRGSAYSVANLDAEMTESTNFFLSNEEKGLRVVRRANNTLLVSQLFRIYQSYFAEAFNEVCLFSLACSPTKRLTRC
eukprot:TRINITY_DN4043_c0_g1_i2.p1 TRINITY_DN4043_c0_g1~~TRINITY_DN4043_c0_g1_i2.p1  ORF type:complete len:259 (+),score=38.17 TRINITY_DN4043_c0_g1_i2:96-872(+)